MNKDTYGVGTDSLQEFLADSPDWRVLDYSQVQLWEQCSQKYEYQYIERLKSGPKVAAEFSSIMVHEPLSKWYESTGLWSPEDRRSTFWWDNWARYQAKIGNAPLSKREESAYSMGVATQIFDAYVATYRLDFDMYKFVNSEQVHWVAWPELRVVWLSKPDVVLEHIADGSVITCDIKQSIYNFNESLIDYDRQFLSQVYTAKSQHMMKCFVQVVLNRSLEFQEIRLSRSVRPVDPGKLSGWARDMKQNVRHLLSDIEAGIYVKRAPKACFDYNRKCEFQRLCDLGDARKYVMDAEERGNPLEYLGL